MCSVWVHWQNWYPMFTRPAAWAPQLLWTTLLTTEQFPPGCYLYWPSFSLRDYSWLHRIKPSMTKGTCIRYKVRVLWTNKREFKTEAAVAHLFRIKTGYICGNGKTWVLAEPLQWWVTHSRLPLPWLGHAPQKSSIFFWHPCHFATQSRQILNRWLACVLTLCFLRLPGLVGDGLGDLPERGVESWLPGVPLTRNKRNHTERKRTH